MAEPNFIAWTDVETTGLDPRTCHLLQAACVVSDDAASNLDEDEVVDLVVFYPRLRPDLELTVGNAEEALAGSRSTSPSVESLYLESDDCVRSMHTETGLWERICGPEAIPLHRVDQRLHDMCLAVTTKRRDIQMGGNSCRLDMNFAEVHLPRFASLLSHHMVDVSCIANFLERQGILTRSLCPKRPGTKHDARYDILSCVDEYRWSMDQIAKFSRGHRQDEA